MKKKYFLKQVENKVSFKPDFNIIKHNIDVKQYQKVNNLKTFEKASIIISLLLVVSLIIVGTITMLGKSTSNPPDSDQTPPENGGIIVSDVGGPLDFLSYKIEIPKNKYAYGEIISIKFQITSYVGLLIDDYVVIEEGDLHVKLESTEYFEVIGTNEYVFPNVRTVYVNEDTNIWPVEGEFKIKAITKSLIPHKLELKMKFNMADKIEQEIRDGLIERYWIDLSEEYFYSREIIKFMSDNDKMVLFSENPREVFFEIVNKQYEQNLLTEQEYLNRCVDFLKSTSPTQKVYIDFIYDYIEYDEKGSFEILEVYYFSDNFKVKFDMTQNEEYRAYFNSKVLKIYDSGIVEFQKDIMAIEIIEVLYQNKIISLEEYNREQQYINQSIGYLSISDNSSILVDNWEDYLCDYTFIA